MGIINGSDPFSKVIITDPSNETDPAEVILPILNEGGLVEKYDYKDIEHDMLNYSLEQEPLGLIIYFTMDYSRWIAGEDLYNRLKQILDAKRAKFNMELFPRADIDERSFKNVLLINKSLEVGIHKGGRKAKFHRLPVLEFRTKYLQVNEKWLPPEVTPEYQPGGGTGLPFEGGM